MSICIVSITDTDLMARTLDRYLRCFLDAAVDSYFMSYEQSLLSSRLFRRADLLILELFRRDSIGYRAEGIFVAEKLIEAAKRVLVVSGATVSDVVGSDSYWDLASSDLLHQRVNHLLREFPGRAERFARLKEVFKKH